MPLISNVGMRSPATRCLVGVVYLALGLGSITMVYPFLLMLANSFTSNADYQEFKLLPRYFHSDKALFKKYVVDKCPMEYLRYQYGADWYAPQDIRVEQRVKGRSGGPEVVLDSLKTLFATPQDKLGLVLADYLEFYRNCPELYRFAYFCHTGKLDYSVLDLKPKYWAWLRDKYKTVAAVNAAYTENAKAFDELGVPYEDPVRQRWLLPLDVRHADWQAFKLTLPPHQIFVVSAELAFQKYLRECYPDLEELRLKTKLPLDNHSDLTFVRAFQDKLLPPGQLENFLRKRCPVIFLKLSPSLAGAYGRFIADKYRRFSPESKAERLAAPFSATCPMDMSYSGRANDWIEFMESAAPLDQISFVDPQLLYQETLRAKHRTIEAVNAAYGWDKRGFADIALPAPFVDLHAFRAERSPLFWRYLTGNYAMVVGMIAVHGRALFNTVVFVLLSILSSLTVSPMAAYALSRYRLKHTNTILLFLLATMAFPAAVGMIPSFLLLKDLGLLNTFAALVLPGLAHGYGIFLLKGFFDSLPAEIFEAAIIDGASEFTIFFRMALPLTKPILAIGVLGAFGSAYGAFMFAFLTCQDPKMWTIMVFLYEFRQMYPNYLVMASLVVSAIPTLIVFLCCQNIILRGIVVPSFK